jgi:hypothetical protein
MKINIIRHAAIHSLIYITGNKMISKNNPKTNYGSSHIYNITEERSRQLRILYNNERNFVVHAGYLILLGK